MSKEIITKEDIKKLVDEVLNEFSLGTLLEAPGDMIQAPQQVKKQVFQKPPVKKASPLGIKQGSPKPVPVPKPKPTSQTIAGPKEKSGMEEIPKQYDANRAKEKQQMSKTQYQIFNIKMRLGKLGLGDTVRRFTQSIHDFDINVTKNSKDSNEIRSYLSPAQGNLVALKGALESLEAEFNELEKLLGDEQQ